MRPAAVAVALAVGSLLLACGCAPSLRVLRGASEPGAVAISARCTAAGDGTRLALTVDNGSADPIGLELDEIAIRSSSGDALRPVGRPQRFRQAGRAGTEGESEVRRVAYGALTVEPRGRAEAEIELGPLPRAGTLTVLVPTLNKLSIDGQVALKGVQVPLRFDDAATAAAVAERAAAERQAFYDPFVDE